MSNLAKAVAAFEQMADAMDRLVAVLEDLAAAIELPALNRDAETYEE